MNWDKQTKKNVNIIVIDDGSENKFYDHFSKYDYDGLNIEIYEIIENIKWNQPGAFNLGISLANTKWVMIMPVDRLIYNETIIKIINESLDENNFYLTRDIVNDKFIGIPPGIILLTKQAFINCGMFDEDFCGNYGYDDILFRKILSKSYKEINTDWDLDVLIHASNEHALIRDTKINSNLLNDKLLGKIPGSTRTIRFNWKRII